MKKSFFLLVSLCLFFSCHKDDDQSTNTIPELEERGAKVTICHIKGNGTFKRKRVNQNALPAHLGHGDLFPDACFDNGLYMNADCQVVDVTNEVDVCDGLDNNCDGSIDEGVEEICDNNIDDDCDGDIDEADSDCISLLEVQNCNGETIFVHPTDNSSGIKLGGYGIDIPSIPNSQPGAPFTDYNGEAQTSAIVAAVGAGSYAAQVCNDLVAFGFDDWYLPGYGELQCIFDALGPAPNNGFEADFYWSSSEFNAFEGNAKWFLNNGNGHGSKNITWKCRCVRK